MTANLEAKAHGQGSGLFRDAAVLLMGASAAYVRANPLDLPIGSQVYPLHRCSRICLHSPSKWPRSA